MTHDRITLQFAQQTISITVPSVTSECLPKHLRRHFAGCLVNEGEVTLCSELAEVAVFRLVAPQVKQWQLWQDDVLLLEADTVTYLLEPLMQAVVAQLIKPEAEHLLFHAGGVALAGRGVLLCGPSGSGKSTLTARLLQAGFGYLSDEVIAVSPTLDVMQGLGRSLVLKAGSNFLWRGQRASQEALPLPDGLAWVTPGYLGGKNCHQAAPRLLLFPQFEAGANLITTPLSSAEAAFYLLQNLANARNLPEQGFRLTAALARQVPAFRVRYGDETAVASWLRAQISET